MFLTDDPQQLVLKGEVADVPFVTGEDKQSYRTLYLRRINWYVKATVMTKALSSLSQMQI